MVNHTPYGYLIDKLIDRYNKTLLPTVDFANIPLDVYMNDQLHSLDGMTVIKPATKSATMKLNDESFKTMTDDQREAVIAHELAHAIVFFLDYKNEHHGARFQRICRSLGGTV
jgi:hypothetical protein